MPASWPVSAIDPPVERPRVVRTGELVTITVSSKLDANAGVELLAVLQGELERGPARVDIDLLAVQGWTPEGARALRRARRLARGLIDGLHYRTSTGAGHEALLDAYTDDDIDGDTAEALSPDAAPQAG
jgi:hypothetical protein